MIFLGKLKKKNDNDYIVNYLHYNPLDRLNGLSKEELNTGFLIKDEELPQREIIKNKIGILHYNKNEKKLWYEYAEKKETPLNDFEKLIESINTLMAKNKQTEQINKMLAQQINNINIKLNKEVDK